MSELEIMLSSPMNGKTKEEIDSQREEMGNLLFDYYGEDACIIRATVIEDHEKKSDLECFSESIWHMSQVDILAMGFGWENARGCKLEHEIAKQYKVPIIYLEDIKQELETGVKKNWMIK